MKISKEKLIQLIKEEVYDGNPYTDPYENPYGDDDAELAIRKQKEPENYDAREEDAEHRARLAAMDAEPPDEDDIADMAFNRRLSLPEIIAHYTKNGHSEDAVMAVIMDDELLRTELVPMESRRITKSRLLEIIKEEVIKILNEE